MTRKDKIQIVITSFLIVFLIYLVVDGVGKIRKSKKALRSKKIKNNDILYEKSKSLSLYERLSKKSEEIELKRNPFVKTTKVIEKGLFLSGIIWEASSPSAIINNQIIKVNDKIGKYTVIEIQPKKVIMSDGTHASELSIQ